ncbi:DUF5802 family protein [Haloarchaeobius salinus]|uniref:DUF5802 family protein n=1 Tax=Haloarchaeobius salinus TaxID=1198298 RepID=UPI00210F0F48|nr:DUF5802 family protein [Haloarchaeobius salinus]
MFEAFSSSYYFGRLYVTPSEGEEPVMQREQHERVAEQLYHDGTGITRVDSPLVMKLDTAHLAVRGEDGVPADTLAVPESLLERTGISNPPELTEVFLAKADRASQLLQFTGYGDADSADPSPRFDGGPNAGT